MNSHSRTVIPEWPLQPRLPAGIEPERSSMVMFQTLKLLPGHILGIEGGLWEFSHSV